jgi:hydrogenase small subunit
VIKTNCPMENVNRTILDISNNNLKKINAIWLETSGCAGEIISFLNTENPDIIYFLEKMVDLQFSNSLMAAEGQFAWDKFLATLNTEFILLVDGAIPIKDNGIYNIVANYNGKPITAMEATTLAGSKAKYVIAVGTCASYGGPTAARPNLSSGISVKDFLNREVIRVPGCPANPVWLAGTIAHIISFGKPELDSDGRPTLFYGDTIHNHCPRRSYFDKGQFAKKFGDKECMFKLGCRGPVTRTDCPLVRWNESDNWPIGSNTTCIGCAAPGFPDNMEPFVRY